MKTVKNDVRPAVEIPMMIVCHKKISRVCSDYSLCIHLLMLTFHGFMGVAEFAFSPGRDLILQMCARFHSSLLSAAFTLSRFQR